MVNWEYMVVCMAGPNDAEPPNDDDIAKLENRQPAAVENLYEKLTFGDTDIDNIIACYRRKTICYRAVGSRYPAEQYH